MFDDDDEDLVLMIEDDALVFWSLMGSLCFCGELDACLDGFEACNFLLDLLSVIVTTLSFEALFLTIDDDDALSFWSSATFSILCWGVGGCFAGLFFVPVENSINGANLNISGLLSSAATAAARFKTIFTGSQFSRFSRFKNCFKTIFWLLGTKSLGLNTLSFDAPVLTIDDDALSFWNSVTFLIVCWGLGGCVGGCFADLFFVFVKN